MIVLPIKLQPSALQYPDGYHNSCSSLYGHVCHVTSKEESANEECNTPEIWPFFELALLRSGILHRRLIRSVFRTVLRIDMLAVSFLFRLPRLFLACPMSIEVCGSNDGSFAWALGVQHGEPLCITFWHISRLNAAVAAFLAVFIQVIKMR